MVHKIGLIILFISITSTLCDNSMPSGSNVTNHQTTNTTVSNEITNNMHNQTFSRQTDSHQTDSHQTDSHQTDSHQTDSHQTNIHQINSFPNSNVWNRIRFDSGFLFRSFVVLVLISILASILFLLRFYHLKTKQKSSYNHVKSNLINDEEIFDDDEDEEEMTVFDASHHKLLNNK